MIAQYRILKFSPVPEFLDPVNVALIVSNGSHRLYFDEEFRRLRCLAPSFDRHTLVAMLNDIEDEVRDAEGDSVSGIVGARSAQLQVSGPRNLESSARSEDVQVLLDNYLMPIGRAQRSTTAQHDPYIDTRLDDFLVSKVGVQPSRMLKRARPQEFFARKEAQNLFGRNELKFSRVVSGNRGIVLVDGVNLETRSRTHAQRRSESVAYSFFRMGQVKEEIEAIEGRSLTRAGVVFGAGAMRSDPHFEYYATKLERECDLFVTPERLSDVAAFQKKVEEASSTIV